MITKNCLAAFEKFWAKTTYNFTKMLLLVLTLDAMNHPLWQRKLLVLCSWILDFILRYRPSTILKTAKNVYEVIFFDMQKYVYSDSVFNTQNADAEKNLPDKINGTKNALFFLSRAPAHHSFTFNLRFLYELKHKVRLSKTVCGIFHFRFRFVFIKVYIFIQQIAWTLKLK